MRQKTVDDPARKGRIADDSRGPLERRDRSEIADDDVTSGILAGLRSQHRVDFDPEGRDMRRNGLQERPAAAAGVDHLVRVREIPEEQLNQALGGPLRREKLVESPCAGLGRSRGSESGEC